MSDMDLSALANKIRRIKRKREEFARLDHSLVPPERYRQDIIGEEERLFHRDRFRFGDIVQDTLKRLRYEFGPPSPAIVVDDRGRAIFHGPFPAVVDQEVIIENPEPQIPVPEVTQSRYFPVPEIRVQVPVPTEIEVDPLFEEIGMDRLMKDIEEMDETEPDITEEAAQEGQRRLDSAIKKWIAEDFAAAKAEKKEIAEVAVAENVPAEENVMDFGNLVDHEPEIAGNLLAENVPAEDNMIDFEEDIDAEDDFEEDFEEDITS